MRSFLLDTESQEGRQELGFLTG